MSQAKFRGAQTAIVTPMKDGAVDFAALDRLVEWQIEQGIDGLVAVGTTGESATLSYEEHIQVVERVVEVAGGRVPVIAGAGANATQEAIELSCASQKAGADGLLQVVPYYNKPTQGGLYEHFAAIARACPLPMVLYNVPGRTACDLQPDTVARLAELDQMVAIKEASNVNRASELIARVGDRMDVLSGDDAAAFPILALGGKGVISVASNVVPKAMAEMCSAAMAGDWDRSRALHFQLLPLFDVLFVESNPIPVKAALELMGKMAGDLRLPLLPATDATRKRLSDVLTAQGLL